MSKKLRLAIFKLSDILVIFTMVFASPMSMTASAMAQDASPVLAVGPSDLESGDSAHVTGSGFTPEGEYVLSLSGPDGSEDWTDSADESGDIDSNSPPLGSAGEYEISVHASGDDVTLASVSFNVNEPPTPTTPPTEPPTEPPTATEPPTEEPTATEPPTEEPTQEPTATEPPTPAPTQEPTSTPTDEPTAEPTNTPTDEPTPEPTEEPTNTPTDEPTQEPTGTQSPTSEPTSTSEPTNTPTDEPTQEPTVTSTSEPTVTPTPSGPPTIVSDKADYAPGQTVILTGQNWQSGESVHIFVNDDIGQLWSHNSNPDPVADGSGRFTYEFDLPDLFVATYSVIATGTSSGIATTTFTDSIPNNVNMVTWRTSGSGAWIQGTLNQNNSNYKEGETVPFRIELGTLATSGNPYTAAICRDYQNGSDFGYTTLLPFNTSRAATPGGTITSSSAAGAWPAGTFQGVNITITGVTETGGPGACGSTQRETIVTFNAMTSGPQYLLWGGRLSSPSDPGVGAGNSASFYPGGSLQMRLQSPDKTAGINPSGIIQLATLTVTKVVNNGSATPDQWCFTATGPNSFNSTLCVPSGQSSVTFVALNSGSYSVTESTVAGYVFASGSGTNCTFSGSTATATVTAAAGGATNASCTFRNAQQQGTITIIKDTVPDDPQDFAYTTTGSGLSSFSLDDDANPTLSNTRTFTNLSAGTYTVTETLSVAGFDLTGLTCSDPDNGSSTTPGTGTATIDLDPNETVTCTYVNTKRGHIIVDKVTSPAADPTSFSFDANGGTSPAYADFSLTDAATPNDQELKPGSYSVTETVPSGWTLSNLSCTLTVIGSGTSTFNTSNPPAASVTLGAGDTVTCTFTNTKQFGSIVVIKDTVPDDPQDFAFTGTGPGGFNFGGGFNLDDDGNNGNALSNTATFSSLNSGNYSVAETVVPGFDTESSCLSSIGDTETAGAIELDPNETVTCTFTNTRRGNIVVVKQTDPDGDPTSFSFTASYDNDGFSLSDGQQNDSGPLVPGTYSLSETVPAGWDLESATCSDGSAPTSISLQAGETVTCTFTNEKDANIVVVKQTDPDGDAQVFAFTASYDGDGFSLSDGQSNDSGDLDPGTYSVAETVPAGWDLTSTTCSDSSDPSSISLSAGETVTCTFNNMLQRGNIVVVKQTDPDGDPTSFTFSASYDNDGFSLSDDQSNDSGPLVPGTYSVSETVPAGWDLTSATCDDNSPINAISLQSNETVTCTFTNQKDASIVVVKQTDPDGDPQVFTFTASYDADGFSLSDGQSNDSGDLDPGTYSVSETVPASWDLTSATCSDGSAPASISLQAGETVTCTFTNQKDSNIVVVKQTNPDGDPTSFEFVTNYSPTFFLTDGQTNDSGDLNPGTYSVDEQTRTGWALTNVTCSDNSDPASISLQAGETVTCTFTNTKAGTIIVIKDAVPNDAQDFAFTGTGPPGFNFGGGFSLDDDADDTLSNTATFSILRPGAYSVAENTPAGWDLTSAICDNGDDPASITLNAGETVTCTFTNQKDANIVVVKETDPDGDPQEFDFTASYDADGFSLSDGQSNDSGDLDPGNYSVSETVPAGWDLTSATCSDGSVPASISLQAGETVTCTFTNTKRGSIVVVKQTDPDGDPTSFTFTASYDADGFNLSDGQSNDSGPLAPGSYSVSETVPAGWDLTSATCSDSSPINAISLQAGETVTCTFNNQKDANIVVVKQTDPDGDPQVFTFTASYDADGFSLSDGQSNNSGDLDPGSYSVSETVPAGWDLTSATCSDGSVPASISLQAGETVTCTFTNQKDASIVVVKQTDPDGDPTGFTFTASYDNDGFSLSDGQSNDSGDLDPGTYSVSETVPTGWDLTSATCSDGSAPASISLQAGETVTCTFTNQKDASIVVVKQTDPAGDTQVFAFTASYDADGFSLSDGQSNDSGDLDPSIYSVAENTPAGWDLTSATCDDGSSVDAISLQAGETVTCTFTNQKDASIVVVKQTDPDGDPQVFTFTASYDGDGFSLSDGQSNDSGDLDPGLYTVTEVIPAGWDLTSATCSDNSPVDAISLQAGETVTCTFTNQKDANIVVVKETDPDGDPQIFTFTASYDADGFSLSDGQSDNSGDLDPGTYSVSETVPTGWDLTSATCSDNSPINAISLQAGETVTCTFTNQKDANVVVVKQTDPDGEAQVFAFTASYDADGFSLSDGQSNDSGDLDPGTYSVSEIVPTGWDLSSATCDNGDNPDSITLNAGETITCTFTNTERGTIIVIKQTIGGNGSFAFTANYDNDGFTLSNGDSDNSGPLVPGPYSVSETVPAGWDLTSATCSDDSDPGAIDLGAGETVTCTFINTRRGHIIVDKVTNPSGDPQSFNFDASGGTDPAYADFSLTDAASPNDQELKPGTYSVIETVPAGWDLESATCSDGSPVEAISLQAGETVTCTFTNEKDAFIIVDKVTNPTGDTASFEFDPSYAANFFLADGDTPNNSGDLDPGTHSVAELTPAGWDLTSAACSDGSNPNAINLSAGETVTCTFTNTKRGHIIVDKVTNPSGDPQSFSFDASGGTSPAYADFNLTDAVAPNDQTLKPGTYSVVEGALAGWDLTGLTCNDANGSVSPGTRTANITLDPGETVTCTFTNTKRGSIKIIKDAVPNDAQDFTFTRSFGANFMLDDDSNATLQNNVTFTNLVPGAYSVTESAVAGWDLTGLTCNDVNGTTSPGTRTANIVLDAGENVVCTFTNTKRGTIIVEKQTSPDGAPGTFTFTGTAAGTIADNGTITVANLVPGTYTSTETNPSATLFALTSIVCNDGSSANPSTGNLATRTATFKLDPGETVRCVFTNSKDFHPGTIGFWKNWRNHYTQAQVQLLINHLKVNNQKIYNKDGINGNADDFTIAKWDAIFNVGNATPRDHMILAQFTALKLNLAITQLDGTGGLVQKNDDLCTAGVVDVSGISGATAFFGTATPTVGQIVNAVENRWTGNLTTKVSDWKFNFTNNTQRDMIIKVVSGINEGTLVMSSGCP